MANKGRVKFNQKKFEEAILFLLYLSPNQTIEGKKKLAKLLYFADFNFFEFYETPITGAKYRALPMGPVPDELDKVLKKMNKETLVIGGRNIGLPNDLMTFSLITKETKLNFDNLSKEERGVLQKVYKDYGGLNGKDLEIITHSEAPYNAVARGEYMPYELSFYRGKTQKELVGA